MSSTISISQLQIARPCHENWANMTRDEKGAFCKVCSKHVKDFTNDSQEEILNYLKEHEGESTCARVKSEALEVPIVQVESAVTGNKHSRLAWFAYALYLVFGSILFSCNNDKPGAPKIMGAMAISEPQPGKAIETVKPDTPVQAPELFISGDIAFNTISREEPLPLPIKTDTVNLNAVLIQSKSINYRENVQGEIVCRTASHKIFERDSASNNFERNNTQVTDSTDNNVKQVAPEIMAYPNPTSGNVNLTYEIAEDGNVQIEIFNLVGVRVREIRLDNNAVKGRFNEEVDVRDLPSGMYIVNMLNNQNRLTTKLMVQH